MMTRVMTWLGRVLYSDEIVLEPGRFETFLSGVAELEASSTRVCGC